MMPADAHYDVELRFGSHIACQDSSNCPASETCAYAMIDGCDASGECVRFDFCGEHTSPGPSCGCTGGTWTQPQCSARGVGQLVWPLAGYWPRPLQSLGYCPGDPNAPEGGPPCMRIDGGCCTPAYYPCTQDSDCCDGRRCSSDGATFKRCTY